MARRIAPLDKVSPRIPHLKNRYSLTEVAVLNNLFVFSVLVPFLCSTDTTGPFRYMNLFTNNRVVPSVLQELRFEMLKQRYGDFVRNHGGRGGPWFESSF